MRTSARTYHLSFTQNLNCITVRINEHGDIEVRRPGRWDVIGGLLGDYVDRVKVKTGLDWV